MIGQPNRFPKNRIEIPDGCTMTSMKCTAGETVSDIVSQFGINCTVSNKITNAVLSNVFIINGEFILRSRKLEDFSIRRFKNECYLSDLVRDITRIQTPNLMKTRRGLRCYVGSDLVWTLYPIIKGRVLCNWWESNQLSQNQKRNVFLSLEKIRACTAGTLKEASDDAQYNFLSEVGNSLSDPTLVLSRKEAAKIRGALERLFALEKQLGERERSFVHGDFHTGNLLFNENDEVIGLLDMDWVRKAYWMEDWASVTMMLMRDYTQQSFTFSEKNFSTYLDWLDLKQEEKQNFIDYFILYVFLCMYLFDRWDTLPYPQKMRDFQHAYLKEVIERF